MEQHIASVFASTVEHSYKIKACVCLFKINYSFKILPAEGDPTVICLMIYHTLVRVQRNYSATYSQESKKKKVH